MLSKICSGFSNFISITKAIKKTRTKKLSYKHHCYVQCKCLLFWREYIRSFSVVWTHQRLTIVFVRFLSLFRGVRKKDVGSVIFPCYKIHTTSDLPDKDQAKYLKNTPLPYFLSIATHSDMYWIWKYIIRISDMVKTSPESSSSLKLRKHCKIRWCWV